MRACILIVDDHEHIRKLIRAFLETEGEFSVCGEGVDGYDAIDKAQALKPDLIILDLAMPRMNGIQAASKIKSMLPSTPNYFVDFKSGRAGLSQRSSSRN